MADTTPLRRTPIGETKAGFQEKDISDLKVHYRIAAAGYYADHTYADISLILKNRDPQ